MKMLSIQINVPFDNSISPESVSPEHYSDAIEDSC